ncbi:MAG: hypothetical protein AB8H80_15605 [Planctomycetota bacterium]
MHPSEELWISRVLDRSADREDWRGLHAIARTDADVWRRLRESLEQDALLSAALADLLPAEPPAVCSALPSELAAPSVLAAAPRRPFAAARAAMVVLLSAGLMALAFMLGQSSGSIDPSSAAPPVVSRTAVDRSAAAFGVGSSIRDPESLLRDYVEQGLASGRVVRQLPLQALSTRRLPDGSGLEVLLVRRLVERQRMDHAVTLAPNEFGQPTPLRVDLANYIPPTNF